MATIKVGEEPDNVGVGCGAGCEIGSTAVVHGAGDGKCVLRKGKCNIVDNVQHNDCDDAVY